jgi:stearoyl-CoA desaturase (delta-9 desaturase)
MNWLYVAVLVGGHALGLLALVPAFFTWAGVVAAVVGCYVFGTLGINLGFHRLLTHRGLAVPTGVERVLTTLGVWCVQDTPARWVTIHRLHHQWADEPRDPHSPLVSLFWAHVGWLLAAHSQISTRQREKYAVDILRDPYYRALERPGFWGLVQLGQWLAFFLCGWGGAWLFREGTTSADAVRIGASLLVWGVFVRTVLVWHITWSVNSIAHRWGYRNYNTDEESRNNLLVGLISNGEGWHNNHHADPRSARHGHRWWELDVTWLTVWALERMGVARQVVRPGRRRES